MGYALGGVHYLLHQTYFQAFTPYTKNNTKKLSREWASNVEEDTILIFSRGPQLIVGETNLGHFEHNTLIYLFSDFYYGKLMKEWQWPFEIEVLI